MMQDYITSKERLEFKRSKKYIIVDVLLIIAFIVICSLGR
jgi:hypothetical protein